MGDLLGLSDEINRHNKHSHKANVIKTIIFVVAILATSAIVHAAITSSNAQKQSQQPKPAAYNYASLGQQCSEALARYNDKVNAANKHIEDISKQSESASQSVAQQSNDYQASQDATIQKIMSDYTKLYESGQITADDYMAKLKALKPASDTIVNSANNAAQAQYEINNTALITLQAAQATAITLTQERDRLQDCVNMTSSKQDIPATDSAAFEVLITKSK